MIYSKVYMYFVILHSFQTNVREYLVQNVYKLGSQWRLIRRQRLWNTVYAGVLYVALVVELVTDIPVYQLLTENHLKFIAWFWKHEPI